MEQRILNVGIIGVGEVAQIIHLPILEAMPDHYRIKALCDVSPTVLEQMGKRYGVGNLYADHSELIAQEDIDVVFVLNSDEFHTECAVESADRGKHVFIEKPMCLTEAEADEIIRAETNNNVKMMVGYMRRYAPAFEEAVKEIGGMKNIVYVRVRDICGYNGLFIDPTSHVLAYGDAPARFADRKHQLEASLLAEATGLTEESPYFRFYRYLTGLSCHDLSAMREALGMPRGVIGARLTHSDDIPFLTVIFDYGSFTALLETGMDHQSRFDAHIEVYSKTKSIRVQYNTPFMRHLPTELHISETVSGRFTQSAIRPTWTDPFTKELAYFHQAITEDFEPKSSPQDFKQDLLLFRMIIDALVRGEGAAS